MDILMRVAYSGCTIYMVMILLTWFGPWLGLEMDARFWGICRKLTSPLIDLMKRILPPLGPINLSPLAAVLAMWLVRELLVRIIFEMTARPNLG